MFGNFLKKITSKDESDRNLTSAPHPAEAAMKRAIAERKKDDPLIALKIGGKEIVNWMTRVLKDEKGVHIQTLLCALGSVAGYACQASIRTEFVLTKGLPENKVFVIVGAQDGRNYYFGDLLNKPLAENQYSIWTMTGGAAQHLGANELIDVGEIFKHVTHSIGSESFGIPRVSESNKAAALPINFVKLMWPKMLPYAKDFCETPSEWPMLFGSAIQEAMYMGKGMIDPALALSIVMESAIPMSKVDLGAF
jgi:hypothetical protein